MGFKTLTLLLGLWLVGADRLVELAHCEDSKGIAVEVRQFQFSSIGELEVLVSKPRTSGPHPAVVYHHGQIVQDKGRAAAAEAGYEVGDFVQALARAGYVGVAPLRPAGFQHSSDFAAGILSFLRSDETIDPDRVAMIGFSRGGAVLLQVLLERKVWGTLRPRAAVFMSPALSEVPGPEELEELSPRVLITLGERDPASIQEKARDGLLAQLHAAKGVIPSIGIYEGDHRWFWKVRPKYWRDIRAFLKDAFEPNDSKES